MSRAYEGGIYNMARHNKKRENHEVGKYAAVNMNLLVWGQTAAKSASAWNSTKHLCMNNFPIDTLFRCASIYNKELILLSDTQLW